MTSAFEESDVLRIKEAIEMKMKKEMDRYRVEIPPSEGKLLTLLKTETLLAKMEFLEDKFVYDCAGYIFTHSSLNVQLKRFLVEEGENKMFDRLKMEKNCSNRKRSRESDYRST